MFGSGLHQALQGKLCETGEPVRVDDYSEEVLANLVKDGKIWQLSAR